MLGPLELAYLLLILQLQIRRQHRVVLRAALLRVQIECLNASLVQVFIVDYLTCMLVEARSILSIEGLYTLVGVHMLDLTVD